MNIVKKSIAALFCLGTLAAFQGCGANQTSSGRLPSDSSTAYIVSPRPPSTSSGPTDPDQGQPGPYVPPSSDRPGDEPKENFSKPRRRECGQVGDECCAKNRCFNGGRCTRRFVSPDLDRDERICVASLNKPTVVDRNLWFFEEKGGLIGHRDERIVGGRCDAGSKREGACKTVITEGEGNCYPVNGGWVSNDDPTDCRCKVHTGVDPFKGMKCTVKTKVRLPEQRMAPSR